MDGSRNPPIDRFHVPVPYAFGTDPWMDSRIWSRLPQRAMDRVLACLPPPAFFRARAVCKRWYALLFSNTFMELYLQCSPHYHCFIFFKQQSIKTNIYRNNSDRPDNNDGYMFDPHASKWYRISFPLIPPGFSPGASSGGLICWISNDSGSKNILLSNPMQVGSLIQLPSTLRPRLCPSIGLTTTATSIDMVFAGDDLISPYAVKNLSSESLHIDGGGFYSIWGTTSSLPRLCSLESGRMVHVDGRFYCMNYSPFSVLCYDVSRNEWSKIQAPMRRFLRSPSLVESQGNVLLVAAVEKSKLNVPKSLRVWMLECTRTKPVSKILEPPLEYGSVWVEMERMPQQLYNEFSEVESGRGFNCVGGGDRVIIIVKGLSSAVVLDFGRKRWEWIPPCPYAGVTDELHGFAYDPRLATPITPILEQLSLQLPRYDEA